MLHRRLALLGLATAATATLAPKLVPAQTAQRLSPTEHSTMTLMAGSLSRQTSELAQERGQHRGVKLFAGFEVAEQAAIAQVLTNAANPAPVQLDAEHAAVLKNLQGLTGAAFDGAYVQAQLLGHEKLLAIQQGYLDNPARTPDGQHIAVLARATIQEHLVILKELQKLLAG